MKLDIYRNDNYMLNDAFDQAVMNVHILKKQHGYKSFVICGCEAGDGTTTVAINLAAALANSGWKTVLIDGDMRKKNRYKRLNENVSEGLSDYLMERVGFENVVCETTTDNLYYIPCGELIDNPVRLLVSNGMNEVKKELDAKYDFIIYDMPAVNVSMDAKVVASNVDAVILVNAIGETSKDGLINAVEAMKDVNVDIAGVIVNKMNIEDYKEINEAYDYFQDEKYAKLKSKKTK